MTTSESLGGGGGGGSGGGGLSAPLARLLNLDSHGKERGGEAAAAAKDAREALKKREEDEVGGWVIAWVH